MSDMADVLNLTRMRLFGGLWTVLALLYAFLFVTPGQLTSPLASILGAVWTVFMLTHFSTNAGKLIFSRPKVQIAPMFLENWLTMRIHPFIAMAYTLFLALIIPGFMMHLWGDQLYTLSIAVGVHALLLSEFFHQHKMYQAFRHVLIVPMKNARAICDEPHASNNWAPLVYHLNCEKCTNQMVRYLDSHDPRVREMAQQEELMRRMRDLGEKLRGMREEDGGEQP